MKGKIFKIRFLGANASLTNDTSVKICELFSSDPFISKRVSNQESYVEVLVKDHIPFEHRLCVDIISYNRRKCIFDECSDFMQEQLESIKDIVVFDSDTLSLLAMCKEVEEHVRKQVYEPPQSQKTDEVVVKKNIEARAEIKKSKKEPVRLPIKRSINEMIKYPIEKLIFNQGYVSFSCKFHELNDPVEIKIPNDNIISAYDSVKYYFANILKTKNITVRVTIEYEYDFATSKSKILDLGVASDEINKITPDIIENVKLRYLKSNRKKIDSQDKTLLTKDDFLKLLNDNKDAENLYEDDEAFFRAILAITNTKHHHHLLYLSEKHQHKVMRLRLILEPLSFIFLLKGRDKYYFIWETSNTKEATYIWSLPIDEQSSSLNESLKKELKLIDLKIKDMLENGKVDYLQKNEDNFERIYHEYTENSDGLEKWKSALTNYIQTEYL